MVHDESNSQIAHNNPILLQSTNLSKKIVYNTNTGDFYIPEKGIYIIHWWINARNKTNNLEDCDPTALSVEFHQYWPQNILIAHSSTHNKISRCDTGTINGNAIFAASANTSYRLINTSNINIELVPNNKYSACVSITKIADL